RRQRPLALRGSAVPRRDRRRSRAANAEQVTLTAPTTPDDGATTRGSLYLLRSMGSQPTKRLGMPSRQQSRSDAHFPKLSCAKHGADMDRHTTLTNNALGRRTWKTSNWSIESKTLHSKEQVTLLCTY